MWTKYTYRNLNNYYNNDEYKPFYEYDYIDIGTSITTTTNYYKQLLLPQLLI